ncbi:histidine triad nucleotide-binding protein [Knoellia sp. 3-2P3]|jgi:histidine triad (HIT) family protein|uniref:histidine triad nucleotide-binding protein n=1 Tax=unclassified Knoellia TaxID=2618719 RepID=UPI0023DC2554|nr:histidine triad nucleotide-binding protein [Knoellia sp. 3-2P3]MDF2092754.1 histidine triad nucleotide-binding protein [Knoellia sp. 3-2P3]
MSASESAADSRDCLFCRIVAGEVPATVVHETPNTTTFRDIDPQAPTHVLVVPKRHVPTLAELADVSPEELAEVVRAVGDVARMEGLERGYRAVFNTGPDAQQSVFHAHVHVVGGRPLTWPPG